MSCKRCATRWWTHDRNQEEDDAHTQRCVSDANLDDLLGEDDMNIYGGYSEDPYDAAKAREEADKANRMFYFAPIRSALAQIRERANAGYTSHLLSFDPFRSKDMMTGLKNEMCMHLRDRGFKVTNEQSRDGYWNVKVEW